MAFTFIVETGAVIPNANSFVDVEYADDYMAANIHAADTWNGLDQSQKEALLVWGSRYLDQRAIWEGYKTDENSNLRWPRRCVKDRDGILIDEYSIPDQLKQATVEMARYLIESDRSTDRAQDGLKSLKVDVIELVFNEAYRLPEVPSEIGQIIQGLGYIKSGQGGHAKILRA